MNEINSFTFYKNYFDLLDNVKKEDKLILLEAIVDYVFKDKEPQLEGLNKAIWNNIKMPLDTSKSRSSNGKNKTKSKQKQNKNKKKSKGVTNNISISSFYISISNLVINKLNELNNTKYKPTSEETLKLIKGRLDDGYTEEDLLMVVEKMSYLWNKEPTKDEKDMRPYLRPSTLFRKSNFENYLNMPVHNKKITTKEIPIDISDF